MIVNDIDELLKYETLSLTINKPQIIYVLTPFLHKLEITIEETEPVESVDEILAKGNIKLVYL